MNVKIGETDWIPQFLDHPSILSGGRFGGFLGLGASDDHLTRGEDEGSGLRTAETNDDGGEATGIVFGVAGVKGNVFEFEGTVEVDG